MFEAESIEVQFLADALDAVCAQNVEGEASETGEDGGFGSNSAVIFEEGDVSNMVAAILDRPMASDGGACRGGRDGRLAGIQ